MIFTYNENVFLKLDLKKLEEYKRIYRVTDKLLKTCPLIKL